MTPMPRSTSPWWRRTRFVVALLLVTAPWVLYGRRARTAYPAASDFAVLTDDGSPVGPLEKLRAPGKFTVFDVYADWCAPCREIDRRLWVIGTSRRDVAIRKLNVVTFESPLARELGPRFDALPFLVVFDSDGKRTEIEGLDLERLDRALETDRP